MDQNKKSPIITIVIVIIVLVAIYFIVNSYQQPVGRQTNQPAQDSANIIYTVDGTYNCGCPIRGGTGSCSGDCYFRVIGPGTVECSGTCTGNLCSTSSCTMNRVE